MVSAQDTPARRQLQILVLLWMVFFGGIVFFGYYLLISSNQFLAVLAGLLMASLANLLAKYTATSGKSIKNPAFIFLLIISAVGVASGMFLNFEGKGIVTEAIDKSQTAIAELETEAVQTYKQRGVPEKLRKVENLKKALFNEISNPANCGQGEYASQYIAAIQKELPGFEAVSMPRNNCKINSRVIQTYEESINQLVERADWNRPGLIQIRKDAAALREQLQSLKQSAETSGPDVLIRSLRPDLASKNDQYREMVNGLKLEGGQVTALKTALPFEDVQSLGSSVNLLSLILSRIDKPTTWIYVLFAFFLDWFTVYLFAELAKLRSQTTMKSVSAGTPKSAWNS